MATRITYTSGASSAELDAEFERALEAARSRDVSPLPHVVGGSERDEGGVFERQNPSHTDELASSAREGASLVDEAVAKARGAQPAWRSTPYAERVAALREAAQRIRDRRIDLAAAVTLETGKARIESIGEIEEAVDLIETYCAHMEENRGYEVPLGSLTETERNRSVLKPYGVFGVIAPFNFPVALALGMSSAALVAGNTVVLKPSEDTPYCGSLLAEIYSALPAGVVSIVQGGEATGRALVDAPVDGVAFTGSAEVGRAIAKQLTDGPFARPALTEMGGKNPTIVTASADLDKAVEGIARSAFGFSGQKCSACSRAIVVAEAHDELVSRLGDYTRELAVGDPAERETFLGPVVNEAAVERFGRAVEDAERDGEVVAGGGRPDLPGWFAEPTVVAGLPAGHRLTRDELFLPFVTVTRVGSLDEALVEANDVVYGLTAGVFSEDQAEVDRFLDEIEAGVVYVNRRAGATTGAWPGIQSFPGWKSSGSTGKGGLGPYYVQSFMREQSQTVAG
ncbi:MAG TPA: aldehyde dehydrogenase family protein [Gaiellaceae bacterium]